MSFLLLLLISAACSAEGALDEFSLLQLSKALAPLSQTPGPVQYPYAQKNVDAFRSGSSQLKSTLNLTLKSSSWVYYAPDPYVMYSPPLLDGAGNLFMTETSGDVFSLNVTTGAENWRKKLGIPQTLATTAVLLGGYLYLANELGVLFCLSMSSGEEKWKAVIVPQGQVTGTDAWSMAGSGNVVLAAGRPSADPKGSGSGSTLYAASADDGHVLWSYKFSRTVYNVMPAIVGETVLVSDWYGGLVSLGLSDGATLWEASPPSLGSTTTGGLAVGPNGLVYVTSNSGDMLGSDGILSAYRLNSGELVWQKTFLGMPANAAPAVFARSDGSLAVVLGIGANLPFPAPKPLLDLLMPRRRPDVVLALAAETGENLWSFQTDAWISHAAAGSTFAKTCWPDSWSNPTVDGAGTVYIGWAGGKLFALSGQSGDLLGTFDFGSGVQGPPAVDSGLLVVASCASMRAFRNL